jgi:hypothetical protein
MGSTQFSAQQLLASKMNGQAKDVLDEQYKRKFSFL